MDEEIKINYKSLDKTDMEILSEAYAKYNASRNSWEPVTVTTTRYDYNSDPYDDLMSKSEPQPELNWKAQLKTPKQKKMSMSERLKQQYVPPQSFPSYYMLEECLKCFDELLEKQIGNIYLTGSVALKLQGKISRSKFKDLDILVVDDYTLDDDIFDRNKGDYPPDPNGTELKSVSYNGVKIDLFTKCRDLDMVEVPYNGKIYNCQSYKSIIQAKMNIVMQGMKDYQELLETSFDIAYK